MYFSTLTFISLTVSFTFVLLSTHFYVTHSSPFDVTAMPRSVYQVFMEIRSHFLAWGRHLAYLCVEKRVNMSVDDLRQAAEEYSSTYLRTS